MNKIQNIDYVVDLVQDGMTVMIGGFLGVGTPNSIIDALVKKNVQNLTLICNDTAFADKGLGKLIANKQIKKVITSHIGTNRESGKQMIAGTLEVVLTPQGTIAEQVRAGGSGLGGFLTPTGVGTIVEEGKEIIEVNGKKFILELPLRADVAIIHGSIVDTKGNIFYSKTTRNFNPLMAMSADKVIVEAQSIVELGMIDPHHVVTPGEIVDIIYKEATDEQ